MYGTLYDCVCIALWWHGTRSAYVCKFRTTLVLLMDCTCTYTKYCTFVCSIQLSLSVDNIDCSTYVYSITVAFQAPLKTCTLYIVCVPCNAWIKAGVLVLRGSVLSIFLPMHSCGAYNIYSKLLPISCSTCMHVHACILLVGTCRFWL